MPITADTVADLITTTLKELGRGQLTVNATDLQSYTALPKMESTGMIKEQSGTHIQLNYMYRPSGSARNVGLFYTQSGGIIDMLTTGSVPWCYGTNHYEFETREVAMNRSPARIVDLVKVRRLGALYSWYDLSESNWWGKPTDSTDITTPMGIDYWIVGAAGTPSFQGAAPAGFTSGAGNISSVTYPRWQNWAGVYTTINKADLIVKIRKAMYSTDFKVPTQLAHKSMERGGTAVEMFSTYEVVRTLEEIAEGQNDNLGNDLASKDGMVKIRRADISAVPYLDDNTSTNPVYGVNWKTLGLATMEGQWAVESKPEKVPNQPTTVRVNMDYMYNFVCVDRRKNFKLNQ